ncbi:MAG: type II secretion system protein [Acidobacteriales bacterium]|nr:type II secretion system protein [Terriglobales bacterium]
MKVSYKIRGSRNGESGYVLIVVLLFVTLMVIALATGLPAIATQIQRDREEELVRRGKQYTRAIQLFYRRFGRYPNSVDELMSTNTFRFLRQKYKDPITGKEEWRLIRYGQARPKPRRGALGGRGLSPSLGTGINPAGGQTPQGQTGTGAGVANASDISKPLSGSGTLGGGPIVGVSSTSEKVGLKEIDGLTHYNEWEFVYDPTQDPSARGAGGQGGGGQRPPGQGPQQGPVQPRPR